MHDLLVKIAAPIGRDADLLAGFLNGAGIRTKIITDSLSGLSTEQRDAAGLLLVAEEALTQPVIQSLTALLANQPKWSDLPFLLIISGGREGVSDLKKQADRLPLGNLTVLERPLRPSSLLSAVQAALRARQRQFEVRDITQSLEAANAEMRMSEQRARLILQSTHDCIKLLDLDGNLLSINKDGQERLGIEDFATVCGSSWFSFWRSGEAESARLAVEQARNGKVGSFEGFFETPSGEATWWDVSVTAVRNDAGEIINLLAVSREITHRKLTEQALRQSEKLAAVGRLASTISHEINNPLEAVTNLIYIAQHSDDLNAVRRSLATADHELQRASQIVGQTLRFHRQSTRPQETSAEELAASVITLYRGRLENSSIRMEAKHQASARFTCFEGEMRQVMSNLVGNAIDAMRGGGRLLIRSHAVKDPAGSQDGVVITIADTGHGMKPDVLRRVFEPFYSTKGDNGTGLGLWITKGIIEKHRGRLRVRSSVGKQSGTVFRLFLPATV